MKLSAEPGSCRRFQVSIPSNPFLRRDRRRSIDVESIKEYPMPNFNRRDFLARSAAFASAAMVASRAAIADDSVQPIRGDEGAAVLGPMNPALDAQNADRVRPPATDNGTMPSLKWSFADS